MAPRRPPLALAYHGLADVPLRRDRAGLFVQPAAFRRQVHALRRWGYRFVTFGELARTPLEATAALTFDDAPLDNVETLLPLLRELDLPATVFVVASWDGIPHPHAPWTRTTTHDEVRALADAGVEIGSHSSEHADLSALPYDAVLDDFRRSRAVLEAVVGKPVDVAAYPYGRANAETRRACRDAGFGAACRTAGEGSWDDPWNLPRQDMNNGAGLAGLWLKHRGWYEPLMHSLPGRAVRSAARRAKARLQ